MSELHSLLKRQLRRFKDEADPSLEGQSELLQAVNEAYWQFDADRRMLEHSLELTSQELMERNVELSRVNAELEARVARRTAELQNSEMRFRGLFESAQRQAQELALLDKVQQALARELELPLVFKTVIEGIAQTFGYTQVSIYLVVGDALVLQHQIGYDHVIQEIPLTHGVSGRVVRSQRPVLLEDAQDDPAFLGAIHGITSEVCVPLFNQNRVAGTLNVESTQGVKLTEADLRLITSVGEQIGIALEHARLYTEVRESEQRFRQLTEHIKQVFWLEDPQNSQMFYVSPSYETIWGRNSQSLYQQPLSWLEAVHDEDRARVHIAQPTKISGQYDIEYRVVRPDGSIRWVWSRAFPILDTHGAVYRIAGIAEDITERKEAEEALHRSEERFKLMAWATKDAVWDWDLQTNQIWWGGGLQKVFHYSSELTQTNSAWWFEHIHPEDQAKVRQSIDKAVNGGMEFWSKEYRFQRIDGTFADIMDRAYILRDSRGTPYRMIGAMLDISERKYMESSLRQTNDQMSHVLSELQHHNSEIVFLNEMSRLLQACNSPKEAYQVVEDLSKKLFPGTTGALYLFNSSRTLLRAVASWGELPDAEQKFAPYECWSLRHGRTHPLNEEHISAPCAHLTEPLPIVSYCLPVQVQGETMGVLNIRSDNEDNIPETKRQLAYTVVEQTGMTLSNLNLREALREQSIRDPLTGLFNRRYMEEVLKQHISRVTRHLHPLGIIMIDIDHFKAFNDLHGHVAGDILLRELGQFLQSHIRAEDVACRYGGEEFLLIMPDAFLEAVQARADLLRRAARDLQIEMDGQRYGNITLSMGVAVYPMHGRKIETVLRAADAALYRGKQEGRDRVIVAESD